jgi:hypothetical protein
MNGSPGNIATIHRVFDEDMRQPRTKDIEEQGLFEI